jgi:hypothetical protein
LLSFCCFSRSPLRFFCSVVSNRLLSAETRRAERRGDGADLASDELIFKGKTKYLHGQIFTSVSSFLFVFQFYLDLILSDPSDQNERIRLKDPQAPHLFLQRIPFPPVVPFFISFSLNRLPPHRLLSSPLRCSSHLRLSAPLFFFPLRLSVLLLYGLQLY